MVAYCEKRDLSNISTMWSMVSQAHGGGPASAVCAKQQLLERYGGAVRRYLLGVLRDTDAADELFQEFALRFMRGDLRGADPQRGRFRDFLKGVLYHMVADYMKRRRGRPGPLPADDLQSGFAGADGIDFDRQALESWRDELLARCWAKLAENDCVTGQLLFTVLRFRADHPELRSAQMAEQLSARLRKPITAIGLRQTLHRARSKFGDLLVAEVAFSLADPTPDHVEAELGDLGLLEYCRPALARLAPLDDTKKD